MDIFEHEERGPGLASDPAGASRTLNEPAEAPADMPEPAEASVAIAEREAAEDAEETVFTVLAGRARTRASAHLWLTAGIGGIDALALMVARPALWWVAAACATVSAYAIWGLADRALTHWDAETGGRWTPMLFRAVRGLAVAAGVAGAVAAALGFIGVALGKGTPHG